MMLRISYKAPVLSLISTFVILLTLSGCSSFPFKGFSSQDDLAEQDAFSGFDPSSSSSGTQVRRSKFTQERNPDLDRDIQRGLEAGALTLGMKTSDVIEIFGQPGTIEYAGDPRQGNQKWIYENGISDRWKLSTPRIVYFEQGVVSGWENFQNPRSRF